MPAIFELLYKEFCRARLAEMRKQLLLTGKHGLLAADNSSDPDGIGETDTPSEAEQKRTKK